MKTSKLHKPLYSIYPGEYVPSISEDEIKKLVSKTNEKNKNKKNNPPLVNITELADIFKIEMAIPGMVREEFLVKVVENVLQVYAIHKDSGFNENENYKLQEFNYEYCVREITLPENVDTELINAEYNAGILRFIVPKAEHFRKNLRATIIVY